MVEYSLSELAEHVDGRVEGNPDCKINHVATMSNAKAGSICFHTSPKYKNELLITKASAVILQERNVSDCPVSSLIVNDPRVAYTKVATLLYQEDKSGLPSGIHPSAIVGNNTKFGDNVWIGPNCVVNDNVVIGRNSRLGPGCYIDDDVYLGENCELIANVTILKRCQVGSNGLIFPGVVIGADGFGQVNDKGKWLKVPQVGNVIIGNDVEIGANTTIDRGAIEDTIVGNGVKLDNQIQVGHNVQIGNDTVIAACGAIGGSTIIGNNCAIGGAVGFTGHLKVSDNVIITGRSLVAQSITEPGVYSSSTPLEPNKKWHRNYVRFKQLDEMARRIKKLEKNIEK